MRQFSGLGVLISHIAAIFARVHRAAEEELRNVMHSMSTLVALPVAAVRLLSRHTAVDDDIT